MTTSRERRFVEEYLRDFNATQAAIRAGYSPRSARHYGATLTKRPRLREAIERGAGQQNQRILLDADRLIAELMAIAFSDIRAYLVATEDGIVLRPLDQLASAETAAILSIAPASGTRGAAIQLRSKRQALRALARHVGLTDRRAGIDPRVLVAETARIREKVLRAAGIDPEAVMPQPVEAWR